MEALKKAERAKQGHTIPHEPDSGLAADRSPLVGHTIPHEPEPMPDRNTPEQIHQPGLELEIPPALTPDLGPNPAPSARPGSSPAPTTPAEKIAPKPADDHAEARERSYAPQGDSDALRAEARAQSYAPQGDSDFLRAEARERSYAKSVFTAKQPANSRKLLIAGISLGIAASVAGASAYYWPVVSGNFTALISGQAPQTAMPAPQAAATATPAPGSTDAQAKNTPVAIAPEAEKETAQPAPQKEPTHASQPNPPPITAAPASTHDELEPAGANDSTRASARSEAGPSGGKPAIQFRQNTTTSQVNPTLSGAYQAFISGNIEMAQQQYHKVLRQEPNNRDALLGLAAVALSRKQAGQAAAYYAKLLELDPSDPDALAGLVGSQGQSDPVQSESQLKKILAQNPQAGALHFALGNLYSQQSRWAEAQQAYFRAYSSTPGNADYAFNLAISLEHLSQGKLALDYYQRALAQSGPASFDKLAVQRRIQELQQPAAN